MATYYVNKSGSNANNGTTKALAKLTIQAGINLMSTGDALVVGSGSYNEKLSDTSSDAIEIKADGVVVVDGNGLPAGALIILNNDNTVGVKSFSALSTGGKWIFKNSPSTTTIIGGVHNNVSQSYSFSDCEFIGGNSTYAIYISLQGLITGTIVCTRCVFYNFNSGSCAMISIGGNGGGGSTINMTNCTAYSVDRLAQFSVTGQCIITLRNNIVSNASYVWYLGGTATSSITSLNNQYYNIATGFRTVATTYATLALAQAAGFESGSITADPNFEDAVNGVFYLKTVSPKSRTQGAIPFGFTTGSNNSDATWIITSVADNTGWLNVDGNVTKNGTTGDFELTSGTSGIIVSPVYDLGAVQALKGINLAVEQTWGTSMVDTTTTDVNPNFQTVEVRMSGTTFAQDDAILSWNEFKTEQATPVITGRYLQFRLTLRSDDVAA